VSFKKIKGGKHLPNRDNPALATIVRLRGPGQDTIGENEEGTRRGYGKYIQ
jgi:hypothetical protein